MRAENTLSAYPPFTVVPPDLPANTSGAIDRTQAATVGRPFVVTNVLDVRDGDYRWFEINPRDGDVSYRSWNKLRKKQINEVASYKIVRQQYWQIISRVSAIATMEHELTYEVGFTNEEKHEFEFALANKLGINFGGGEGEKAGSLQISNELNLNLKINDLRHTTETVRQTRHLKYTLEAGFHLGWQLINEFSVYRLRTGNKDYDDQPINSVEVPSSGIVWTRVGKEKSDSPAARGESGRADPGEK